MMLQSSLRRLKPTCSIDTRPTLRPGLRQTGAVGRVVRTRTQENETMTKQFHIGDILSVSHGRLVSPTHIDGVYAILNYMTGDKLFTHQLPRACRECEPWLRRQFPWLNEIRADGVGRDNWQQWLDKCIATYGEHHDVEPIPQDDHDRIDPLADLQEMVGKDRVIVAKID